MDININDETGKVSVSHENNSIPLKTSGVPALEVAVSAEKDKIADINMMASLVKKSKQNTCHDFNTQITFRYIP